MAIKQPSVVKQAEVSQLIRELRLSTGLTQEQFAAHTGVTYPTIGNLVQSIEESFSLYMELE